MSHAVKALSDVVVSQFEYARRSQNWESSGKHRKHPSRHLCGHTKSSVKDAGYVFSLLPAAI
jgi:hypothetical protein